MAILSLVLAGGASRGRHQCCVPTRRLPAGGQQIRSAPPNTTRLVHRDRITGDISPKSVVASPAGDVIANNMMYNHTSTLYDASSLELAATVPDTVDLAEFGFPDRAGETTGAPVEAVFSPDGRFAYVSQYSLKGPGAGETATDDCAAGDAIGNSAVYRLDLEGRNGSGHRGGAGPKFISSRPTAPRAGLELVRLERLRARPRDKGEEIRQILSIPPRGPWSCPTTAPPMSPRCTPTSCIAWTSRPARESEPVLETGCKPRHLALP